MLVIARDTAHASEIVTLVGSEAFFQGRYREKVIQVDSSVREDETVERLLRVERADEPTEIVVHVNMLKEGWDVTNLYTIVPLRAASARTLIEQSIGRGLRLPYGRRTGVEAVDRLNIVAHDRFQEIVDEARRPGSVIRLRQVVLTEEPDERQMSLHISRPRLVAKLGLEAEIEETSPAGFSEEPAMFVREDRRIAEIAYELMRGMETEPGQVPSVSCLLQPEIQEGIVREVQRRLTASGSWPESPGCEDVAGVVVRTAEIVVEQTIDIPRILVVPRGEVRSGFRPFTLDLSRMRYEAPGDTLWVAHLRTGRIARVGIGEAHPDGERGLEDYVVAGLADLDDISYEQHAELLHELAGRVVRHFLSYLPEDEARNVLQAHQQEIAAFVHAQMQPHFWQEADGGYDVRITRGFTTLQERTYARSSAQALLDFRRPPPDRNAIGHHLFCGFERCLYGEEKFQSDSERKLAVVLDRESLKWFRPARGQFQIFYRSALGEQEYQPDFVAELASQILMAEAKPRAR
ncbi:MAG: hypothetical protein AB7S41_00120 [Parvibaculaceae bacterium]